VPDWWPVLLLFVFATHGPFFAWRWWRTREIRHAATTLTFALLVVTYALRVFAPEARAGELALWQAVRIPAWAAAALSLTLLARHGVSRLKSRDEVG
jgi:hypothetical protein